MILTVLSGKGGTGKTSILAAFAHLSQTSVKVDCDVDAPNLSLYYQGLTVEKRNFYGGNKVRVNQQLCISCEICEETCKFGAIKKGIVDLYSCEGCGACRLVCPQNAITLYEEKTADILLTKSSEGMISRAKMEVGSEGSGKLITQLRKNAKRFEENKKLTLIDGSPGIGCSVIASITDTEYALIVTEPTKSGIHDMKRILSLAENFDTKVMVCINKYDINPNISKEIEEYAVDCGIEIVGKIPFDTIVMESVNALKPITEYKESIAGKAIKEMWNTIINQIGGIEL